jgi:SPP1 family predicted phage head-tail adaptor
MNPGKLNKRIEFGRFKSITNDSGFQEKVWSPMFKKWASVKNLFGKEFWEAKAVQSETTVKFKCRYDANITADLYIKFRDNYYEIISPPDNIDYKNVEIEIKAKILDKDKVK